MNIVTEDRQKRDFDISDIEQRMFQFYNDKSKPWFIQFLNMFSSHCLRTSIFCVLLGKTSRSWQIETVKKEIEKDESIERGRVETGI